MRPIATDAVPRVVCVCIHLCVGHAGEPCKTAELTKITFMVEQTCMDLSNHVLDWGANGHHPAQQQCGFMSN